MDYVNYVNAVLTDETEDKHYILEFAYRYTDCHGAERYEKEPPLVVSYDGLREIIDELQTALKSAGPVDEL